MNQCNYCFIHKMDAVFIQVASDLESNTKIGTLQDMACQTYTDHCPVGTRIPYDIPGTHLSWVKSWVHTTGFHVDDDDIAVFISECMYNGSSSRKRVSYGFRRRVEMICDTIGINRGPHGRKNLSDMVLKIEEGFTWRKSRVTSYIVDSWKEIR